MRTAYRWFAVALAIATFASAIEARDEKNTAAPARWTAEEANHWYAKQPWLVGSNYIPATASNELEMWQAETFDSKRIDLELGWAESIGLNTMRVFLHDSLWKQNAAGLSKRLEAFLAIAAKHHIRPVLVLFDSCWDPNPVLGKQMPPRPGVHNSRWLQSPGVKALEDRGEYPRLEAYVRGVVGKFGHDERILAWDVWNEPDNTNDGSYNDPKDKVERVLELLPKVFAWAREAGAQQPLTSGVWAGDWSSPEKLSPMAKIQLEESDVISFHNYDKAEEFEKRILSLQQYGRPLICTEYMARGNGSTFEGSLPLAKKYSVGAINWGLVAGKTQTYLPWDSWKRPYTDREPEMWFHEIFRTDGKPYKEEEVVLIRKLTGRALIIP
jgi:hypothetical protein